jgi:hypothetical protein
MFRPALLLGALAIALAGLAHTPLGHSRPVLPEQEELPLFPSGRMLRAIDLGQPTLIADLAWLQAIQYYGKHRMGDRQYPLAAHLFDTVVGFDPAFRTAYLFGALVLEEATGSLDASRELLRRGEREMPMEWMFPFSQGFMEYRKGNVALGAREMERASRLPGAPGYAARLAAHAYARAGRPDRAEELWEAIERETEDPGIRALARQRLQDLRNPVQEAKRPPGEAR